jgi:preprotein translocase subunit SecA
MEIEVFCMLSLVRKIFGTRNDKEVKKYLKKVQSINALEEKYGSLSDDEIKKEFEVLRSSVLDGKRTLDDVLNDSFAITKEVSKRTIGLRHYDVQLVGGMVLHEGKIAEMKTGEGKTLVATLPIVLNAMMGKGVHLVTVNDYLASRDAQNMAPIYNFLGFSVGVITGSIDDPLERQKQYKCDITYGTNNEFGFDYLRDNMTYDLNEKVQQGHFFSIVDEVDSILIDEARTPLIISGPTNKKLDNYSKANEVAKKLQKATKENELGEIDPKSGDFTVDEKNKTVIITENGVKKAEELFEVENLYELDNASLAHHLNQALKAQYLFEKDVDYVVKDNEVIIVDEFTGRLSEGRRFGEGLHQALEAKENVVIQEESQTLADITFQNYFRMYDKLAGMTGTAQTEATEFDQIYSLDVISIPTNKPIARIDANDLIFKSEKEKFDAVVKKVQELHKKGQPVLIGTASIEKSEYLSSILKKAKLPHSVLNAKNHQKEAGIIENAGIKGTVTIATNMAGRGVDIKINDEVKSLGGLFILGTERHESRRIDNQLRGRSGRQGDPGNSQFFLSLEDNLLRIFGSDRIKAIMERLGVEEGEHIESKMVTRAVENAQKKVESMHFESRKHLLEYDDVANEQRKTIYLFRDKLLNPEYKISDKIKENRLEFTENTLQEAEIFDGAPLEDFNFEKVKLTIKEELNFNLDVSKFEGLEYQELLKKTNETLTTEYEKKFSVAPVEQRNEIERVLYLQVLDNAWREHLYNMDILKTGIGLRGYNQKDPLVEYKKESFGLFGELVSRIKFESLKTLHIVQLEEEKTQAEYDMMQNIISDLESVNQSASLKHESTLEPKENKPQPIINNNKIQRNAPCPCGSGKKYKQCCGQSGPKKGVVGEKTEKLRD